MQNRIRFKFIKAGESKFLSHLDITRFIIRALARADIGVEYSHGYNPKPKINFSNPTPLGVESFAEYSDIILKEELSPVKFLKRLNKELEEKLKLVEAKGIKGKPKSLMSDISVILYSFKLGIEEGYRKPFKDNISEDGTIKDSIYSFDLSRAKSFYLLKLFGYAKILKNQNNRIFKYNYFYDYFTDIVEKYSIDIYSVVKEEMFVLRDGLLRTPMEVI